MRFSSSSLAALSVAGGVLLCSEVSAFAPSRTLASSTISSVGLSGSVHHKSCPCSACTGIHQIGCACNACARTGRTLLFADVAEEAAPAEVEALDGIASAEEAHNADRPARKSIAKKERVPKGTPLSELSVGDTVKATVKTITTYGAFMDIGAQTDGLLHISRLASGYVKDVNEVLKVGQEVEARIFSIDEGKNQVGLSLMTEAQEEEAAKRPQRQERSSGPRRSDNSAILNALQEKGWDQDAFVDGKVASTVAFGAFVRFDASQLNSEVEGELDGLVHISSLSVGRAGSVEEICNVGDAVKVRCKGIQKGKISLSMIAADEEQAPRGGPPVVEGAKDWKEQLEKARESMPVFSNEPLVVDMRG